MNKINSVGSTIPKFFNLDPVTLGFFAVLTVLNGFIFAAKIPLTTKLLLILTTVLLVAFLGLFILLIEELEASKK